MVKCLSRKHEDLSLEHQHTHKSQTWEHLSTPPEPMLECRAQAGESLELIGQPISCSFSERLYLKTKYGGEQPRKSAHAHTCTRHLHVQVHTPVWTGTYNMHKSQNSNIQHHTHTLIKKQVKPGQREAVTFTSSHS